eukprot:scaffold4200_cov60-Phaeocystis_antarctica.AAC.4
MGWNCETWDVGNGTGNDARGARFEREDIVVCNGIAGCGGVRGQAWCGCGSEYRTVYFFSDTAASV